MKRGFAARCIGALAPGLAKRCAPSRGAPPGGALWFSGGVARGQGGRLASRSPGRSWNPLPPPLRDVGGSFEASRCISSTAHQAAPNRKTEVVIENANTGGSSSRNNNHNNSKAGGSDLQVRQNNVSALVARQRQRGKHKQHFQPQEEEDEDVNGRYINSRFHASNRNNSQVCVAYCTAEKYDFDQLLKGLQKDRVPAVYFAEVIHVSLARSIDATFPMKVSEGLADDGEVFFFTDGCVVFWGVNQVDVDKVLHWLLPYETGSYSRQVAMDEYSEMVYFRYGKDAGLLPSGELVISIGNQNWARTQTLEKIAFSYGMQRSVKVGVMEAQADALIESLKHIPDILMEKRALKMDQRTVMKVMGRLLSLRGLINLHLPLGETPEAYWEEPWLEELYHKMSRELDLSSRIRTLNRKLDYAHQVVEVLRDDISEKHHTRLEIIIIGLIAIEVLFGFLHFFI